MSKRQNARDREYDAEEYFADDYDDFEIDFPDDEFPDPLRRKRQLSEEEIYELRRKKRRAMQLQQKRAAKRRERAFVAVFIAALLTVSVGLFLIIRAVRSSQDPGGSSDVAESEKPDGETSSETQPESTTERAASTKSETPSASSDPSDETDDPNALVTDATKQTEDPLKSTDENGNWVPPYPTNITIPSWITQDFIDISEKTRPGRALTSVDNIVIHYVGNPGTTAKANRDYFNDIQYHDNERGASAHFVVGFDGEIIQCVPLGEMAQANYPKNDYTISIETCHPDETGKFTETTYRTLIKLTAWLCEQYGLTSDEVIRHYDVSGKLCPIYYCPNTYGDNPYSHEEAWEQLKADVKYYMWKYPNIAETDP